MSTQLKNKIFSLELQNKALASDIDKQGKVYRSAISGSRLIEQAVNAIKDPIAIMDRNFKIEWVNDTFSERLNIDPDDINGQACYKLLHKTDEPPDFCPYKETLKSGCSCHAEILNTRFGDYLLTDTHPIYNEVGELTGAVLIARNISDLIKSREDRHKFETRLQTLLDTSPDIICFKDSQGRWLEANRSCLKLFELESVDYKGKKDSELASDSPFYERAFLACEKSDEQAWKKQIFSRSEEVIQTPKGSRVYDIIKVPFFHENGRRDSLILLGREITHNKLAIEALSRSENAFKKIFNSVQDIICIKDEHLKYKLINSAMERFCNRSATQVKGKCDDEIFGDYAASRLKTMDEQALAGNIVESKIDIQTKNSLRTLHVTKLPIYGHPQKQIRGVCTIGRDVTEEIKLDERLRQAHKMEALGTLAGGIAHDFNNILMSIIGYAEMAMFDLQGNSKAKRNITAVLNSANRARDLVGRILTFSRQEKRYLRSVDVAKTLDEVLKLFRSTIPSNIEIRRKLDIKNAYVLADSTELYQVIMNLCVNAAHAMRQNGGVLSLDLRQVVLDKPFISSHPDAHPGNYIRLTVSDNGEGIPHDNIKKIFDPYFTTKDPGEGTGLGLSVVHGILKEMGGCIQAYSELNKGTTFAVFLPKIRGVNIEYEEEKETVDPFGREHVLVVDDEYPIAQMIAESLEHFGYTTTMRTSSIEALEAFKKSSHNFDAVITDLTMPNMTGDRLIQEIRKIRADIPIILCTGYSERLSPNLLYVEASRLQMKPASGYDLAVSLRSIIDSKNLAQ